MSDASVPAAARIRRFSLIASLCLNVALIAVIAVMLGRAVPRGFIGQPGGVLSAGAILREVPPDEQARIQAIIDAHQDNMQDFRIATRRSRQAAFRTFAAPDFSKDAFAKALEKVHAADGALEEESILTLREIIATLTPQQRQAIVEKVKERRSRFWRRL